MVWTTWMGSWVGAALSLARPDAPGPSPTTMATTGGFASSVSVAAASLLRDPRLAHATRVKGTDALRFVAFRRSDDRDPFADGREVASRDPAGDADPVTHFLAAHGVALGLRDARATLTEIGARVDALGHRRRDWAQHHLGQIVFGAGVRFHLSPEGTLRAVTSGVARDLDLRLPRETLSRSRISAVRAQEVARSYARESAAGLPQAAIDVRGASVLGIFDPAIFEASERIWTSVPRLAYRVDLVGGGESRVVFVDAETGRPLAHFSRARHLERRVLDRDGDVIWSEFDPPYEGGDADVEGAIAYTREIHELFLALSGGGYRSFDGADAVMEVMVGAPFDRCPNAAWNGAVTAFCPGTAVRDVVGHEWTHAYTQYTHGLFGGPESGALDEAFADVFGETLELLHDPDPRQVRSPGGCARTGDASLRWLMGDGVRGLIEPFRDLWSPECRNDPTTVDDPAYYCGPPDDDDDADDGGVHTNSTLASSAFAHMVDGFASNRTYHRGIGLEVAASLYWRAMTVYQTETTDFAHHADAVTASCEDWTGQRVPSLPTGGTGPVVTPSDCATVRAALDVVGLRRGPACPSLFDPNPVPVCGEGRVPFDVYRERFETDAHAFRVTDDPVDASVAIRAPWQRVSALPGGGVGYAFFAQDLPEREGCVERAFAGSTSLWSPIIALPEADDPYVVTFDHFLRTELGYDGGNVKLSVNGGPFEVVPSSAFRHNGYEAPLLSESDNPMGGEPGWSGGTYRPVWGRTVIDLRALAGAGDRVQLRFDFGVDGCAGLEGWYVTNVALVGCAGDPGAVAPSPLPVPPARIPVPSGDPEGTDGTGGTDAAAQDDGAVDRGCVCAAQGPTPWIPAPATAVLWGALAGLSPRRRRVSRGA